MVVDIEVDFKQAEKQLKKLGRKAPESADQAAEELAHDGAQKIRNRLIQNGSTVTGEGLRSIDVKPNGHASYLVVGRSYLLDVEQGTPPHIPDTKNPRFQAAARQYGIPDFLLAATIAEKGTEAHPFIVPASQELSQTARERARISLARNLQGGL